MEENIKARLTFHCCIVQIKTGIYLSSVASSSGKGM